MNFLTKFSLRNPVAVVILVLLVAIGGILSSFGLQEDLMPDLSVPILSVVTPYPGASPSEVANDVTTPIEKALNGTSDVQTITSTSVANVSEIELQLNMNADLPTVEQNVEQIVNQVQLPTSAQRPTVRSFSFSNTPILAFTVASSKLPRQQLKNVVNNTVIPALQGDAGVASVTAFGADPDNVVLQFDPNKLNQYHLSVQQVLAQLQADNASMPLGTSSANGKLEPVQLNAAFHSLADIRNLQISIQANPSAAMGKALGTSLGAMGQAIGTVAQGEGQLGQSVAMIQVENRMVESLLQVQDQIFGAELALSREMASPQASSQPAVLKLQGELTALKSAQRQLMMQLGQLQARMQGPAGQSSFRRTPSTGGASSLQAARTPEAPAFSASSASQPATLQTIPLSDIATVAMQPPVDSSINRTNGQPSILVTVAKTENANTVAVVKNINQGFSTITSQLPAGVHIVPLFDSSQMIKSSVNGVLREAVLGALFAALVILLFLRNALTTLVAVVSIPLSVLTAVILLSRYGITLNIMTLGGLAVATGRVVDDSIVVIENIYRTWKRGLGFGKKLVMYATAEVGSAILSSTLATIAVFLPLALVGGMVGKIFFPFALTVVCALASSLIVALTVVPMLAWLFVVRRPLKGMAYDWLDDADFSRGALHPNLADASGVDSNQSFVAATTADGRWQKRYQAILTWCLNHKMRVIFGTTVLFVASIMVLPLVGSTFIENSLQHRAVLSVTMPIGTSLNVTAAKAAAVEHILRQDTAEIQQVNVSVGGGANFGPGSDLAATNTATLDVALNQNIDVTKFLGLARRQTANLATKGATIDVRGEMAGGGGTAFDVVVTGSNAAAIHQAATEITNRLQSFSGLANVQNNLSQTEPQISIVPNSAMASKYGLTAQQIASVARNYLSQQTVGTVNFSGQTYNLNVTMGRLQASENVAALRQISMSAPTGQTIKLGDVANVNLVQTPTSILHDNGQAYAEVTADYTTQNTNKTLVGAMKAVQALHLPSGVHVAPSSSAMQQSQSFTQLIEAILAAVGIVYIVMLILFGEWSAPFAILFSMPVALIGAFFGTFAAREPFSISSLIGILMLMGIVVTNAIVLVQRVEQDRSLGMSVRDALLEAGTTRLRPILMTAVATVCALLPLALGVSDGVLISKGLAVVVIGGLVTSTVLTLCIVPLMYELLHRRLHRMQMTSAMVSQAEAGGVRSVH